MKRFAIVLTISLLFCSGLQAVEMSNESAGETTRRWLELQRSGAVASPVRQRLSGPVAEKIHERYVNSFEYPIPETYYQDQNGDSGLNSTQ